MAVTSPSQIDKIQDQLNKIVMQLAPLASLVEDIKTIKADISDLKESHEMAHQLLATLSDSVQAIESRVNKVEKVVHEVPAMQTEIIRLQQELENRDQWSRANNVEIRGIPQTNNEDLYGIAQKIGQLCNFPIKKEDINYIARIPTRVPNKDKSIIVAFNNRYIKEELVALARKTNQLHLLKLGFTSSEKFYVNDHLTQRNKTLLNKARSLAKEKNFKYIWVKHCKIMARKSDSSHSFFIRNENDLMKIT